MWKSMKKGFGFASGVILGHATMNAIAKNILKWIAKDEKYMEGLKNRDKGAVQRIIVRHMDNQETADKNIIREQNVE